MGRPTTEQSVTEVSVVLPAYNEEDTIEQTVGETLRTLSSFLPADSFEVIVAEDGCDDRTPELAEQMAANDDRVRHFHSDERLGRGGALEHAFAAANGEVLVYFDTDLATDMNHLEELVDRVRSGRYDVATGSRWMPGRVADRPAKRGVPSRAFNLLVRLFLGSSLRDHQCGFKAFSREVFEDLRTQVEDEHWFWDTEMLVRAQRAGYRVDEFPVDWTPKGDTKVDLVRDVFGMGSQIVRTWWQVAVKPRVTQRVAMAAGAILTILALLLMTQYISFGAVVNQMQAADPVLVAVAALVYLVSWPVRGVRYRDILAELGFKEKASFLTGAVFISQTGNLVFPARLGDVIRAYIVKARRGIPYPSGFASLAAERVFDLLTITALAGVVLVGYTATGQTAELAQTVVGAEGAGQVAVLVAVGVALAAILAVAVIVASAQSDGNLAGRLVHRASSDSYAEFVAEIVQRFVDDLQAVAGTRRGFARIGVSSLGIWMLDVATAMLVLAAFDPGLAPIEFVSVCFFAVSVGNLAKVLPLSPGGVGLYEGAFTLLVIGLTGISPELALGAAVLDHAVKNIVTVIGGYASMVGLNVSLTTAVEESKEVRESREAEPAELD
ncbi:flippase-like domain-containing protein [Halogeometricum sp. S1BR25-6]|uniref:Flippase-like domain-containing protein n=1 Tax=Halogeometricum salsisoli TaxID=2950536 RepID=A0ABU2GBD1_9EURY|nr:flippase-like domain-containing protein [Halogeometricum sp. S1BR25-6]MDS0298112.1 flippase-like domain-containing protein [Halogeometricum sp. S1BR25-6]